MRVLSRAFLRVMGAIVLFNGIIAVWAFVQAWPTCTWDFAGAVKAVMVFMPVTAGAHALFRPKGRSWTCLILSLVLLAYAAFGMYGDFYEFANDWQRLFAEKLIPSLFTLAALLNWLFKKHK